MVISTTSSWGDFPISLTELQVEESLLIIDLKQIGPGEFA